MTDLATQLGKRLGQGSFRIGYAKKGTEGRVIKEALTNSYGTYHNWLEWFVYHSCPENVQTYLAKVYRISEDGKYLEMQRTEPWSASHDDLPPEIMNMFADTHGGNYGHLVVGNKIVIHDYAMIRIPGWNDQAIAPQTYGVP